MAFWENLILSPFLLLFITAFLGLSFGKIKFGKFSFGACGALIIGLLFGWGVINFANQFGKSSAAYQTAQRIISDGIISNDFFNFFLLLFVIALGLISGKEVVPAIKQYGKKFLAISLIVPLIGFLSTLTLIKTTDINPYQLSGVYTGAMLSTPAFAESLESTQQQVERLENAYPSLSRSQKQKVLNMISPDLKADNVAALSLSQKSKLLSEANAYTSMGHSISYPVCVILAIMFIILVPKLMRFDIDEERVRFNNTMQKSFSPGKDKPIISKFNIPVFTLTAFVGVLVGSIKINNFSLGITGGSLIAALILSAIGEIGPFNFRMDDDILGIIKSIGLSLFLATVGLNYGYDVIQSIAGFGFQLLLIGLFILFVCMVMVFLVGRYLLKLDWLALSGATCGGITNTPPLGAAIDSVNGNEPAIGYGIVYPFSLVFKIIFSIILLKLFLI